MKAIETLMVPNVGPVDFELAVDACGREWGFPVHASYVSKALGLGLGDVFALASRFDYFVEDDYIY